MDYIEGDIYHIYNRGNNKKPIFFEPENYHYFLRKVKRYIYPNCDILSYALMPNHFHFLIHANEITQKPIKRGMIITNALSEGLRLMLSSYAHGINIKQQRTGSLFQQNTKSKCVSLRHTDYSNLCFHYIHQNPYKSGLVTKMENWPYSSFNEFLSVDSGKLCNKALATELLDLNISQFYVDSYGSIDEDLLKAIF